MKQAVFVYLYICSYIHTYTYIYADNQRKIGHHLERVEKIGGIGGKVTRKG